MNRETRRRCGRAGHPNRKRIEAGGSVCFDCMSIKSRDTAWVAIPPPNKEKEHAE